MNLRELNRATLARQRRTSGSGLASPAFAVVAGTWRWADERVELEPYGAIDKGVEDEAERLNRWLRKP